MKSHRRYLRRVRRVAVLALCVPLSASAGALAAPAVDRPTLGSPKIGDTPADYPGSKRAREYDPPETIQVVRPERTIVRDADDALPTILASLALLVALGGTGFAVVRTRAGRGVVGRTH